MDDVEQTVHKLKEQLNVNTKEAAEIEIHLAKVQDTISAAEGLVIKLDDEYSRWSERVCFRGFIFSFLRFGFSF